MLKRFIATTGGAFAEDLVTATVAAWEGDNAAMSAWSESMAAWSENGSPEDQVPIWTDLACTLASLTLGCLAAMTATEGRNEPVSAVWERMRLEMSYQAAGDGAPESEVDL